MRRGGVLILLIGLILIVGAVALFLFLQPTGGSIPGLPGANQAPTGDALPTEEPVVEVVRARVDIPANTVITDSVTLLEVITIPQSEIDTNENVSSVSEVEGKLVVRPFRANELIVKSALVDPGLSQQIPTAEPDRARDKAYPFVVNNLTGVADQIKPGDVVDVVATFVVTRSVSTVTERAAATTSPDGAPLDEISAVIVDTPLRSTKTIVQRAQVIRILKPPVEVEPTPEGGAPEAPETDASGQPVQPVAAAGGSTITPGTWTLVLAINDQEVELMEFAVATEARLVLVLRGAGDGAFEPTIGANLDLLIDQFGLPQPEPLEPHVIGVAAQLTPQPTRTPAPTRVP